MTTSNWNLDHIASEIEKSKRRTRKFSRKLKKVFAKWGELKLTSSFFRNNNYYPNWPKVNFN
jgi:hypothetical protein